jgi:hypothetical protein
MVEGWDKEDFESLAQREFMSGIASGALIPHLQTFFSEAFARYEDATDEGKAFVDDMMAKVPDLFDRILKDAPDNADLRRMRRIISLAKGKHPQAQKLIDNFPILAGEPNIWIDEAKSVLCNMMQCLLDLLHDATQRSHNGAAKISILGLFYWLIDELTTAQYLARRAYNTQAYTHLRVGLEILDKIDLFTQYPELVEVWGSDNEEEIWKKLAPPRVREKLGRDSRDPMYTYFSREGSHATFRAMQPRLRKTTGSSEDDARIGMMLGGRREPARQVSILIYCILVTTQAIVKSATVFEDRLNPEDVTQLVTSATKKCFSFYGRFLDSVDRSKDDVAPLEIILASWQAMREKGQL